MALATPPGRGAVAIVRVSGPAVAAILQAVCSRPPETQRQASVRRLYDAEGGLIDEALVLWFAGPASATGEDVAEFHVHAGPAVIEAMLARLTELGARPAQPGEFSRRAFANGRMDLTQAEAIADLVDAETQAQRVQALRQMAGELGALYEGWRTQLVATMARVEASIDFPDEGDVPALLSDLVGATLASLRKAMAEHLDDGARGERVRDGFQIALIGAPNAGKSTLLNALLGRDAAIVTSTPGTTRDVVEGETVLAGHRVRFADTAGIRQTEDAIEREGVRRAKMTAQTADMRIAVLDGPQADYQLEDIAAYLVPGDIAFVNKSDLGHSVLRLNAKPDEPLFHVKHIVGAAALGEGLKALREYVACVVTQRLSQREAPSLTRARHRHAVEAAAKALARAEAALAHDQAELAGEDLRQAAHALGTITGRVDVEDILDRVFADFCIGK